MRGSEPVTLCKFFVSKQPSFDAELEEPQVIDLWPNVEEERFKIKAWKVGFGWGLGWFWR